MSKSSESGLASSALIIVLLALVLVGSLAFGFWAFSGRQDYKNKADVKIAAAVKAAKEAQATELQKQFDEQSKSPTKSYQGPVTSGSIAFSYPKTWSAYIDESGTGDSSTPVNGYFHPNFVPGVQESSSFALRVQVVPNSYSEELKQFDSLVSERKVKISAYSAPKVSGIVGVRVDGQIINGKKGSMVMFPLRDKTLKVWTEADQFVGDFNNSVLPNLTFVP